MNRIAIAAAAAFAALGIAGTALAADAAPAAASQAVTRAADLPLVKGSPEIFTGDVHIQPLSAEFAGMPASSAYVIFEAGSRSYWHTHPVGQVLIIAEGEGRSGVYGEPVSVLKKGDVVVCPKGVKHFHGAAPDQRMVQMTITPSDADGKNVTWMEAVTDEQYMNVEKR